MTDFFIGVIWEDEGAGCDELETLQTMVQITFSLTGYSPRLVYMLPWFMFQICSKPTFYGVI